MKCGMRNAGCGIIALFALALFISCAGPAGEDGEDGKDGETGGPGDGENDDDTSDDDADDDDAPNCAVVWLECEYQFPIDLLTDDECGLEPPRNPLEDDPFDVWAEWEICDSSIHRDENQNRADCGLDAGCQDWKYDRSLCRADGYRAMIDCASLATWDEWKSCFDEAGLASVIGLCENL